MSNATGTPMHCRLARWVGFVPFCVLRGVIFKEETFAGFEAVLAGFRLNQESMSLNAEKTETLFPQSISDLAHCASIWGCELWCAVDIQ